jgi:hypothetical protein
MNKITFEIRVTNTVKDCVATELTLGASEIKHGLNYPNEIDPQLLVRFQAAKAAAEKDGQKIYIASGFRTLERQKYLFAAAVKKYGSEAEAAKWVAPPALTGTVTFYVSGNCVNGTGGTSGDQAAGSQLSLPEFSTPLYANVTQFSVAQTQQSNSISWTTAQEKNNAYFYTYFDTLNSANTFFNHNAIYYWRVRLRDTRNAWSNWSNTWNFRVRGPMAIENLHFEISKTDSTKLNLRWKRNELDSLTTKYRVLNTNNPTSVYIHETQVSNSVTTSPFLVVTPDSNKVAFRVFAQDNSNNYSPPGSIVTLPEVKYIQLNQNLDLTELSENLQHPFPNYPSLERAYFYLYDSTYFQQVDTKKFLATLKGRTILSICYLRGGDTVFKKQILFHIIVLKVQFLKSILLFILKR